jgi:hypothetical protein
MNSTSVNGFDSLNVPETCKHCFLTSKVGIVVATSDLKKAIKILPYLIPLFACKNIPAVY